MATAVQYVRPHSGEQKNGFNGFSWTTLFFGPFPSLIRGHGMAFLGLLALGILTAGVSCLIAPFFINPWHRSWLNSKGYVPLMTHALHAASRPMVINNVINNAN